MQPIALVRYTFLIFFSASVLSDNCKISWMDSGNEVAESQYALFLSIINTSGNLDTYFPDTYYDITIKSILTNHTFTQFYFTISNVNKSMSYGTLELREKELSMFHNGPYCINRIIDGPVSLAKQSIKIGWQSPPVNSGCVDFRAAIKETELRYHTVNITVCEDPRVVLDDPGEVLKNCCACDEGKYELAFEGLWSRYTHPKHFPQKEWLAVFPTVVGASHSHDYEFWHRYTNASNGLKRFSETGYTVGLELELKENRDHIKTLIKFRGANFQNKSRQSYTGVRVSRKYHVLSLVARIDPSPDWFIGISSLELCRPDCTWVESKALNLYAYDAGVRSGILYEDLDAPTEPNDVIQSLNMTWPLPENNIEPPFYDKNNNTHDVRPLARIYLTRLRGSEKSCQNNEEQEDEECTTDWSDWGPCSVDCGIGISKRNRTIKDEYKDKNCTAHLDETRSCEGSESVCEKEVAEKDCVLTEWGEWTKCGRICGQEVITHSRSYKWPENQKKCQDKFGEVILAEKMDCGNPPCPEDHYSCADEKYNNWMDWGPCIEIKGTNVQFRYRTIKDYEKRSKIDRGIEYGDRDYGYSSCLYERSWCTVTEKPPEETPGGRKPPDPDTVINNVKPGVMPPFCLLPLDEGSCPNGVSDNSHKYYYDQSEGKCVHFIYAGCGGNENRFNDEKACTETCVIHGQKIDCELTPWTEWTPCKNCNGYRTRSRKIKRIEMNGGRRCSPNRSNREECRKVLKNCRLYIN